MFLVDEKERTKYTRFRRFHLFHCPGTGPVLKKFNHLTAIGLAQGLIYVINIRGTTALGMFFLVVRKSRLSGQTNGYRKKVVWD